jgi:ribosomal protein S18 acetylase RimI-like enzyme
VGKSADTLLGLLLSESITRTHTPSWMRAFAVYRILTTQYQPFFQPILTFVRCLSHRYRPLQQWFCVAAHPTVLVSLIGRSFWWVMHHQRPFAVAANLALSAHNQLGECASTEVCLHLDQADTLPVFQGQGLFRALVRLCLRCHRDATLITLCVAADNTAAQAAYKNVGFGWRETVEGVHTYALSGRNLAQLRSSKCLLSEATPPGLQFTRLTRSPLLPEEGERGVGAELYLNDLTMRHALPMQL